MTHLDRAGVNLMDQTAPAAVPRILSIGQCRPDHGKLSTYLADRFQAKVEPAANLDEARELLRAAEYDLVLVNRILNRGGASGLDLIESLRRDPATATVPVMLVSNHADAQEAAVKLGALPGFGKGQLRRGETFERIKHALAHSTSA